MTLYLFSGLSEISWNEDAVRTETVSPTHTHVVLPDVPAATRRRVAYRAKLASGGYSTWMGVDRPTSNLSSTVLLRHLMPNTVYELVVNFTMPSGQVQGTAMPFTFQTPPECKRVRLLLLPVW